MGPGRLRCRLFRLNSTPYPLRAAVVVVSPARRGLPSPTVTVGPSRSGPGRLIPAPASPAQASGSVQVAAPLKVYSYTRQRPHHFIAPSLPFVLTKQLCHNRLSNKYQLGPCKFPANCQY